MKTTARPLRPPAAYRYELAVGRLNIHRRTSKSRSLSAFVSIALATVVTAPVSGCANARRAVDALPLDMTAQVKLDAGPLRVVFDLEHGLTYTWNWMVWQVGPVSAGLQFHKKSQHPHIPEGQVLVTLVDHSAETSVVFPMVDASFDVVVDGRRLVVYRHGAGKRAVTIDVTGRCSLALVGADTAQTTTAAALPGCASERPQWAVQFAALPTADGAEKGLRELHSSYGVDDLVVVSSSQYPSTCPGWFLALRTGFATRQEAQNWVAAEFLRTSRSRPVTDIVVLSSDRSVRPSC